MSGEIINAFVEMDIDGVINIADGDDTIVSLPAVILVAAGLFDEGRATFESYEEDVDHLESILRTLLEVAGCEPTTSLTEPLRKLCVPGGGEPHDPADYMVRLERL